MIFYLVRIMISGMYMRHMVQQPIEKLVTLTLDLCKNNVKQLIGCFYNSLGKTVVGVFEDYQTLACA